MNDQLSSDLASLRIDRENNPQRRGPLFYIAAVLLPLGLLGAGAVYSAPFIEARLFKTEVAVTEIASISASHATTELTSTGYVMPQTVSQVAHKVFGKIAKVFIKQGAEVKEGDILLELDAIDQEASIAAARARAAAAAARVHTAKAGHSENKRQQERAQALANEGVGPKAAAEDLAARSESLEEQIHAAEAEVKAANAEVAALQVGMKNLKVLAPISGTVLSKPPEVGEALGFVAGGLGAQGGSIEIADLSTLAVETDVPEARLHQIKVGQPTEIVLDAYPDRRYRGKTIELVPRVNRAKATATVKVTFVDPADGVLPDMSARVSFLSKEIDKSALTEKPKTVVPSAALTDRNGAKVVFVIDGDLVRMTPVTLGGANGNGFELMSGPGPGTRVVRDPPSTLVDGVRIKQKGES